MRTATRTRKITSEEFLGNGPDGKAIEKEVTLQYREYENFDEFFQDYGGPERALKIVNRTVANASVQAGINHFNNSIDDIPSGDTNAFNQLINALSAKSSNYRFEVGDGVTGKEAREAITGIRSVVGKLTADEKQNLSAQELLEKLAAMGISL